MRFHAAWTCANGTRRLVGNGVPQHRVGAFPNPGNPNTIAQQRIDVRFPLNPQVWSGEVRSKVVGYALNGVKFDPGTAESCTENCANGGRGPGGAWRIEALNQTFFDFGVDGNNAHVQPNGAYHYHGVPIGLITPPNATSAPQLLGWAMDGFPIYADKGYAASGVATDKLVTLKSSWRVRASPIAGRPPIAVAHMGVFEQDYEFVEGLGDLDRCNGRSAVTQEFPDGVYHYVITTTYPYVPRCLRGQVLAGQERGPPPGGPRPPHRRGPN